MRGRKLHSAQAVRDALQAQGWKGKGEHWQCPAHPGNYKDRNLRVREAADGAAMLTCHSHGCTTSDILTALGLLGQPPSPPTKPPAAEAPRRTMQQEARQLWKRSNPIECGTAAHAYFHSRLRWPLHHHPMPACVRCAPASRVPLTMPEGAGFALLYGLKAGPETAPRPQAVEIDAITAEGKLTDPRFRRTLGPKKRAALWIPARTPAANGHLHIAVAEGPLDALAVFVMSPTRLVAATMGTAELKSFNPPLEARSVEIWADAGAAGTGAAIHLARRLQRVDLPAQIILPNPPAQDPAEELTRRYAAIHKENQHG